MSSWNEAGSFQKKTTKIQTTAKAQDLPLILNSAKLVPSSEKLKDRAAITEKRIGETVKATQIGRQNITVDPFRHVIRGEDRMKNFKKVTILGSLLIAGLLSLQCGPGWKTVFNGEREADARLEARKAQVTEAIVRKGIQCYEQGDLERAKEAFEEVLSEEPTHPEAFRYRTWLQQSRFCTVYDGDTLTEIAGYYYEDPDKWSVIAKANRIEDPKKVRAYHRLLIPYFPICDQGKDELGRLQKRFFKGKEPTKITIYPVKKGDSLGAIARGYYGNAQLRFFLADYNHLEEPVRLNQGTSLKIPVFSSEKGRKRNPDNSPLHRARNAMESEDYMKAYSDLLSISKRSSSWPDAVELLGKCKSEGSAHYARLGDRFLEQSDPERACFYWEQALRLNPDDGDVRRKLEDARELIRTLQMLHDHP